MGQKWLVGVDLGGTTIKMAFLTEQGDIVEKWEIPTDKQNRGKNITADIAKSIEEKLTHLGASKEQLKAIGIGAPGPVNSEDGSIYVAVNLGWENNYPLAERLAVETSLPVFVDNDANVAALGEMWKGAGAGAKNMVCVTLGTGVGGGVIVNGEMVRGVNGAAGEIGHIATVFEDGVRCNCGNIGCLETVASATGVVRLAEQTLARSIVPSKLRETEELTAKLVFDAASMGDELALKVVDKMAFYLGVSLANMANVLNPEKIVLGGGVSKAGDVLLNPVRSYLNRYAFPRVAQGVEIVTATLGNDAGVVGAAWLAK